MTKPSASTNAPRAWLRSPWWDLCCLGFCWVPFYLWLVFGLGLDGSWGRAATPALGLAMVVALAITYVHRHYTFILVYGDAGTFSRHSREFVIAPIVTFALLALMRALRGVDLVAGISPWMIVLVSVGLWNVWHSVMQRYGILRVYAGRSGGGLEVQAHGRRDFRLLWVTVLLIAVIVLVFRAATFAGHANAARVLRVLQALGPLLEGPWPWLVFVASVLLWTAVFISWLRCELRADVRGGRAPRLLFLLSTAALFSVFIVHGPIIGYLCFGVAHALEYVAFVHHFGERKFGRKLGDQGLVARWMRRPWVFGPLLSGALIVVFVLLRDHRRSDVYLVYYMGTSILHFLFDGWIWRVRTPEVGTPLGLREAALRTAE
ncbi:MAG TPA: hypothetical protein ENJ18_04690 [Nannocystis exedens]|nr:hypothetical protein [Nannocystis exedens]